ncbi:glycine/betaine ABC transporter substrate-binding protein [Microbacterium sp. B35-04]|uniref:glycine betaine ABC transporter substrate-binding protein n=1 Tax=unclassified Microbacterium TaxID=2609290 RepID=UPI0013D785B6|nr:MULTISPECIES: glycine betaine ABC transporter substrate-binding protein [unclassified Microbacterium]KAF2414738.1 glycine/betaine ABC transporter substrate-binding protein [Microbacterium sp. B35-04]KAF2418423.1 glycine/betaine ABC transporter substrate-binding protein [Microbacterium sp. B35-30]
MITRRIIAAGIALAGTAGLLVTGALAQTGAGDAGKGHLTIAVFNGWDEGIAASELWKAVLEEEGYTVELAYADPAAAYTGIAQGDYDLTLDTWLPLTHADYMDTYGDDLVDLGAWNDEAKLTIAVNEDAPIDSLTELAANADLFGNRLVGIEAGSGLVTVTQDDVIPGYGLEGMDFVTASTPAMLTELQAATVPAASPDAAGASPGASGGGGPAGRNVAVTLWRPHWAYNAFPIKDLEDPDGLLGDAEGIHTVSSTAFVEEQPEVSRWLEDFRMDNELLYSLEDAMFGAYDGDDYGPVVAEWIADNRDWVDGLTR